MIQIHDDNYFMEQALKEAHLALANNEIPIGCVITIDNKIIAKAHNQTELLTDVTAHAEILAITSACDYLGGKYLNDCTIYITMEPCPMCAGALKWSQIGKIVYGAADDKNGFMNYGKSMLHPKTKVAFGVKMDACSKLVTNFFKLKRKK
ncbi:MAG: nucleoside deaminase [Bacteroidetes bacterium]|nr:nucleoside deaminase [Bacteroidota bacterium]